MIKNFSIVIAFILLELLSTSAHAAFCSLRDPVSAIHMLYKDGYEYRSLVTTVTEKDRARVKMQLPFTIHQSEVGKHTLYVVYENANRIGFLQARSEWAKWGLVEIAWAINNDRSIKGFYFQRCRSPQCNDTVSEQINTVLKNKNFTQLKMLLSDNGESLSLYGKTQFKHAPDLALLALRSALKTLAITDLSWENDINKLSLINKSN